MATCPSCEREVSSDAALCPYDGARLDTEEGRKRPLGTILGAEVSPAPALAQAATLMPDSSAGIEAILSETGQAIAADTMMGEYKVVRKLGEGGMGEVYAAVHPIIGKKVAIKVLSPMVASNREVVRRFIDEARSVNQIGHPNIVDIFSFGQHSDGRHFFVMEHLVGESLEDALGDNKILPTSKIVDVMAQALDALQAAHDAGIVHRDLKPDNIFLTKKGKREGLKLLDFGIAKLGGEDEDRARTQTGMALGTPDYMSPEQCRGVSVDYRTDIYACGVLLFRMFTGHFPFEGEEEVLALFMRVLQDPPDKPSEHVAIAESFESIILKCLAKEAEDRFQSAGELSEALSHALESPSEVVQANKSTSGQPRAETSDEDSETARLPVALPPKGKDKDKSPSKEDTDVVVKLGPNPLPPKKEEEVPKEELIQPTLRSEKRSRKPVIAVAIAAIVLAVGTGVLLSGKSNSDSTVKVDPERNPKTPAGVSPTETAAATAKVIAVQQTPADAQMEPGVVHIRTNRKDAEIYLDGALLGKGKDITLRQVVVGQHKMEVAATGHRRHTDTIDVVSGENPSIEVMLVRSTKKRPDNTVPDGPDKKPDGLDSDPSGTQKKPPELTTDGTINVDFSGKP